LKLSSRYPFYLFLIALAGMLAVVTSCSTKKNTFTRRAYHNLTAHYNVYWNGMDNLRSGTKEFETTVKDNYALVLPVYNYGDKSSAGKMGQYADIAIKKASKTIQKHSMVFNRKENVKWIDDAYLLMGKGYFFKQDYGMARRTFEFVIKNYNENEIKYDGMLWMAKANNQAGDFGKAEPMLDMLLAKIKKGEAPARLETDVNLEYAQFSILQKNYEGAVIYLQRALELNPDSRVKTRCLFILGQIAQKNADYPLATSYYKNVLKRNPSFDMSFNTQINLAQCYDIKSGDREYITKKLNRMLKDDKNKDNLDQVYYALAQVSLRDSDTAAVIGYLAKSVSASKTNNYQKAISSLQLADIYFDDKNYPMAQAYYDSTMQFLPKDFPNYKEISSKTATLTDLVENLQNIQREDSLQMLAQLPEAQRTRVIDGIIAKLIAEEMRKKQEEQEKRENQLLFGQDRFGAGAPPGPAAGGKDGKWYFYNTQTLSTGFTTFVRKWGRRKLEDNWFLSDKAMVGFMESESQDTVFMSEPGDTTSGKKVAGKTSSDPKSRDYYLKDIPATPEALAASNDLIIQSYYNLGFIYIDGLGDYGRSIESFETLLDRFPTNKYKVQSIYELNILYTGLQNQPKSDYYRDLLLNEYPETDYAKLMVNPDYYKEIQARQSEALNLYAETFNAFNKEQYYMVLNNAGIAMAKYAGDTSLMPKFEYLRALSLGKIEVEDSLVVALQGIVKKYPKSSVKPLAASLLNYLSSRKGLKEGSMVPGDSAAMEEPELKIYAPHPGSVHFYVLLVDGSRIDVTALKIKIADFNTKFFSIDELQVNSLLLDNTTEMVTVNNFDDAKKAIDYYNSIKSSKYVFTKLENVGDYADFVIAIENYPIFYRSKNKDLYIKFFQRNYPVSK
jgi:tetratricopeptide (TPR) repeat protein